MYPLRLSRRSTERFPEEICEGLIEGVLVDIFAETIGGITEGIP